MAFNAQLRPCLEPVLNCGNMSAFTDDEKEYGLFLRACQIAREKGGYEYGMDEQADFQAFDNAAIELGAYACQHYPVDAKAMGIWQDMKLFDTCNIDRQGCPYDVIWQAVVAHGVQSVLSPPDTAPKDDRQTAGSLSSSIPADMAVPHSGAKNLHSCVFQLEPPTPEMLDVNVHDHVAFREARAQWMGGSDAPKLVGNPWNHPNDSIAIYRGEQLKPAVDKHGWMCMCMGHEAEPNALADFADGLGCVLTDSAFYHIPGTMMVITPDSILKKEDAGPRLSQFFEPPFSSIQPVEVKSHVAGIKDPAPKKKRNGDIYYPHEATFIQACLQWFAVNGTNQPEPGVVPSFFLVDHWPKGNETCVWHVYFPDALFYTRLFAHLERCRKALLAPVAPHVGPLKLPLHTVVCERIM